MSNKENRSDLNISFSIKPAHGNHIAYYRICSLLGDTFSSPKSALQLKEFKRACRYLGWALSKQSPSDVFTNLVRQDPNLKFLKLCLPGSPGLIAVHPESAKVISLIKRCNF
jgi:hypothetical protein